MTVRAVLTTAQEEAFRAACGVRGDIEAHFHGWSKRVLLSADRAFLFPRDHTRVKRVEREAAALHTLESCAHVPDLIARHDDDQISPYPFLELARLAGAPFYGDVYEPVELNVALDLMTQLGPAIAGWHKHPIDNIAAPLQENLQRPLGLLERSLLNDPTRVAAEASYSLQLPIRSEWVDAIAAVQSLPPVLTHGDVHGEQLMVDAGVLTGVIDWETTSVDNPIRDFDFSEWGRGWFRAHEPDFAALREHLWTSYSNTLASASLPKWQTVHTFFSFVDAWRCVASDSPIDLNRRSIALANLKIASP